MASNDSSNQPVGKPKGWHSRRHQTSEAHMDARQRYMLNSGPAARRRRALERAERKAQADG